MNKLTTKFTFIGKVGVLFAILIVGAYVKPAKQVASNPEENAPIQVQGTPNEIDANSLIRRVSYRSTAEPVLRISKK